MKLLSTCLACTVLMAMNLTANAATISSGDVTTNLDGTLFVDDAAPGGTDATKHDGDPFNPQRNFDLNGDGLIGAPGVPGTITIQGFGFATSGATAANDAASVTLTFTYLGANENVGGGDDIVIGTETVNYDFTVGGEYFVNLDTDPSAFIDGLGDRFRISISPDDLDGGLQESLRIKQVGPGGLMFETGGGIKFSVSGTFVPVPEPTSALLVLSGLVGLGVVCRR